jgi:hypothetical protein
MRTGGPTPPWLRKPPHRWLCWKIPNSHDITWGRKKTPPAKVKSCNV